MIDPLIRRLAIMIGAVVLVIPVALSLRSGDDAQVLRTAPAAGIVALPVAVELRVAPPAVIPVAPIMATTAATTPAASPAMSSATIHIDAVKRCNNSYTVVSGDYWIRLADGIGVPLRTLLSLNRATVATPLYPGRSICLPAGAVVPVAKATPSTTVARSTTTTTTTPTTNTTNTKPAGKNSTGTKTSAPTTTAKPPKPAAPATTAPPVTAPPNRYTAGEVETIIREVWPDDLEDEAVRIASRESHLIPTARNSCCIGLFQIYYSVHRTWLSAIGITSAAQLFDPRANTQAALALYQRSGGWGPWATG